MTAGDSQLSGWTKKLQNTAQSQTCTQKRSWSLFMVCCQSDPLPLSESWQNHYNWEVDSANWWDALKTAAPAARTGRQKGPSSSPWQCLTTCRTVSVSKVEWVALCSLASSAIFTCPLANWPPLLHSSQQHFAGKALPQPKRGRRVYWIPKRGFLCCSNRQTYFSLAKMLL